MLTIGWPLTFLRHGQIYAPIHLYGENVEKSYSQNVLKTYGWKVQCMIKVIKLFSNNQNLVPWGLSVLAPGLYTCLYKIVQFLNVFFSETTWAISTIHVFHMGPSVKRVLIIYANGSAPLNKMAAMPVYGKNT